MSGTTFLDFEPDYSQIEELEHDADLLADAVVQTTGLRIPVRFVVGGVDMLPGIDAEPATAWIVDRVGVATGQQPLAPSPQSRRIPVLGFLATLDVGMSELHNRGIGAFYIPEGGHIRLRKLGERIRVVGERGQTSYTTLEVLRAAIDNFRQRVLTWIAEEARRLEGAEPPVSRPSKD